MNDKDQEEQRAFSGDEEMEQPKDPKASAQERVKEIKRRKAEAKKAEASESDEQQDKKLSAQERVKEIKRRKAEAKKPEAGDEAVSETDEKPEGKLSAQERVKEIKRRKAAKKAESGASSDNNGIDGKSAAQDRVREIARKKALKKKEQEENDGDKGEKSDLSDRVAAAKAKVAAAKKAKAENKENDGEDADKSSAKAKAMAKAKARAKAKKAKKQQEELPPSPNQPVLDRYVKLIEDHLGKEVLEDSYINRLSKDVPTLVARPDTYYKLAEFLHRNEQLGFDFLSEIHGTDFETHMEVYAHLFSFKNRHSVALKVKVDRDKAEADSLTPIWEGANWPEREAYDLLGITFIGHPNLERIMMPDDWEGHPLRKDYEPYDVEV